MYNVYTMLGNCFCLGILTGGCKAMAFFNSWHLIKLISPSCWLSYRGMFKDTWSLWCKNRKNLQLLDILAHISANKPSFQNRAKRVFVRFWIDGLLAELQARMSRSCRISLFLHHNYQVSLRGPGGVSSMVFEHVCLLLWLLEKL